MFATTVVAKFGLDGVGSYLIWNWVTDKTLELNTFTLKTAEADVKKYVPEDYNRLIFLGLELPNYVASIDKKNVLIINNHAGEFPNKQQYGNAKIITQQESSLCTLTAKIVTKLFSYKFQPDQQDFIDLVDDYSSYARVFSDTKILNFLFWFYSNNINVFVESFKDGFYGFTEQQQKLYDMFIDRFNKRVVELSCYCNDGIEIDGHNYNVLGVHIEQSDMIYMDNLCDHFFHKNNKIDIIFFVDAEKNRINIRRRKESTIDLRNIARILLGGNGVEYAASGTITEEFLNFSRNLIPCT